MKLNTTLMILGFTFCASAYALPPTEKSLSTDPASCRAIVNACKAAGYGEKNPANKTVKGKSIFKNCFTPIYNGGTVKGVNVINADVIACKQKKGA